MDNPLLDVVNFLQKPGWPTPVFWVLLAGGIAVASYAFVAIPGQRSFVKVWNLVFRLSIGAMWWQANPLETAAVIYRRAWPAFRRDGSCLLDDPPRQNGCVAGPG